MAIEQSELFSILKGAFPKANIEIKDLAGDNDHYHVTISCVLFEGLSRLQQHRKVFKALEGIAGIKLHALSLTTRIR